MSEQDCGYDDLGLATLDTSREERTGFPEVVLCEGKPDAYLPSIFQRLVAADGRALGTRAGEHQASLVREVLPQATYDPIPRVLSVAPEAPTTLPWCARARRTRRLPRRRRAWQSSLAPA